MSPAIIALLWSINGAVCALAGYTIGSGRDRAAAGAWLGLLLGPLGIIIVLFLEPPFRHDTRPR